MKFKCLCLSTHTSVDKHRDIFTQLLIVVYTYKDNFLIETYLKNPLPNVNIFILAGTSVLCSAELHPHAGYNALLYRTAAI